MHKKGRIKYFIVIFICFSILIYGFIKVNINKTELARKRSKFTIDLRFKPIDLRIETKGHVVYLNNKIINNVKEKCINTYNEILSK